MPRMPEGFDYNAVYQNVHGNLAANELVRIRRYGEFGRFGASGPVYDYRMNLPMELGNLPTGAFVWDGFAGNTEATHDLAQTHRENLKFLAISVHVLPRPWESPIEIPFIVGMMEDIDGSIAKQAQEMGFFPPQVILLSNGLHYALSCGTHGRILEGVANVLPVGGKALVYEDSAEDC